MEGCQELEHIFQLINLCYQREWHEFVTVNVLDECIQRQTRINC